MDFSNYKFRCSGLGKLMTNGRDCITDKQLELIDVFEKKEKLTPLQFKKLEDLRHKRDFPELSDTTKSYLNEVYIREVFNRQKDTSSKYTEKGLYVEEDSLELMQSHYNRLLIKNKETFENEFVKGTPDVIMKDINFPPGKVLDAKSSWDIFTFFEADGSNKDYFWQGQGYMYLTGLTSFDLCYCLSNAPEHLIVDEKQRQMYKRGLIGQEGNEKFLEMESEVERNMKFDDIDVRKRIKVFSFKFDPECIVKLLERIQLCRQYLNEITF